MAHTPVLRWVDGDLPGWAEVPVSETTATFLEIIGPMRAEFALDPVTGDLAGRRAGLLARLCRGLAVLGCLQGQALATPAVTGIDVADGPPQEK